MIRAAADDLERTAERFGDYIKLERACSENTRRAYLSDLSIWTAWCRRNSRDPLDVQADAVSRFLLEAHFDSLLPTARLSPLPEAHPARTRGTGRSGGTSPGKDAEQGHLREKPDPANAPADSPARAALFFQQEANRAEKEIGRINRLWIENRYRVSHADSLYLSCARSIDTLMRQLRRTARELCRMQPGSLLPVLIANKQVGNRPVFELEDPAQTEFLLACAREMQETRKGNPHAERFLFNMERIRSFQQQEQLRQMEKNEQETRTEPARKPASRTAPHSRTNLPDNPPKHPGN